MHINNLNGGSNILHVVSASCNLLQTSQNNWLFPVNLLDFALSLNPSYKVKTSLHQPIHKSKIELVSGYITLLGPGNPGPMYFPIILPFHFAAIISPFPVFTNTYSNSLALFWNILLKKNNIYRKFLNFLNRYYIFRKNKKIKI